MPAKLKAFLLTGSSIQGISAIVAGALVAALHGPVAAYVPMIVAGLVSLGMPQKAAAPLTKTVQDVAQAAATGGAAGAIDALVNDLPSDITAISGGATVTTKVTA